MKRFWTRPFDLRTLILFFVLLSVLATLCNALIVAYRVQREALIHSALEANAAYAAKVASSIGAFLRSAQGRLQYSTEELAEKWNDPAALSTEANRLHSQDADFDSIAIVDVSGKVLQIAPSSLALSGQIVSSEAMKLAIKSRRPSVSSAYVSISGNLVVFISQPVLSASGELLGVIGGSVYLLRQSTLHTVISSHFHHEGTFVFVADANRRLLYHPDPDRIGEVLHDSTTTDAALRGEAGSMEKTSYLGIPMIAGFAPVPDAHWAVVAQQPREKALAALQPLMLDMTLGVIPAGIAGLALILAGTALISRPLRQLTAAASQLGAPETSSNLLRIHAWYSDAAAIREALLSGVQLLQQRLGRLSFEAQFDALTELANRRAMMELLNALAKGRRPYALLMMDIDFFKKVNDTFGHDAGDVALKHVADIVKKSSRAADLACRMGGEEFALVMPDTSLEIARLIAERIREFVAVSPVPGVGGLTISIGIACTGSDIDSPEAVLKRADDRLYHAKRNGRNQVAA
jgi:diguanylate cyclase (GGDEF)-like protein